MIPKDLLRKIRRIQIRTSRIVSAAIAGQYHSTFKGRGMEFEEVRNYEIGDDVRAIDWNVSARHGEPFVKVFHEERELTVMLLVDLSRSHQFGTSHQLKQELAVEVCATLAFSALRNNDKTGMISFAEEVEQYVPPRKGARHVLRIIRDLLYIKPRGKGTNLTGALEHLNRVVRRRCVVFLVSDFQARGYERALQVAARRHDLIPVTINDPREVGLPDAGLIELVDAETGEAVLVDASDRHLRRRYSAHAARRVERRARVFKRCKIDSIDVTTGEPFIEPMNRFFKARKARL
ncbi:MAG: DUF58 domain-containing protein [Phycisphaerales bacterium]|nr:MAG: DUF58 domain-containing protein [Phycisphaerales bacterium]